MKNNFITKIIGATLAFAMMIGGAVGINAFREAKEVNADDVTYKLTIDASSFNTTSYAANNNEKTSTAVCTTDDTKTYQVKWTSNQVMKNGDNMQWQKSAGYIYNSTNLGTISSVVVTSTAGTFTTNYGTSTQPSSGSAGDGKGFFKTEVGSKTGYSSKLEVTFTITEGGGSSSSSSSSSVSETYAVTYANGGATSGTVPTDNTAYESGDTVTILGNTGNLAKEDYTFGGWTDGENEYQAGNTFDITSNKTLTAIWNLDEGVDALDKTFTGSPSSYTNWSNKAGASGAVYAGNSSGGNDSIQLRTTNSNSGVVSTTSGGNIKKVTVIWNNETVAGRTLNVYAKNTAYSSAADLYSASTQGTLVGTIVKGTSTSFTFSTDYRYVGVRSSDNAMYLAELHFKWEAVQLNPRVEFSPASLTLKTNQTNGATITALVEDVETPTYSWVANDANIILENANTATVTVKPNTNVAANSSVTLTVGGVTPNLVETVQITIEVPAPGETAGTAYTVAQAKTAIAAAENDIANVYIAGIVSQVDLVNLTSHQATYWISDDGTTNNQFKIYNGKYVDGVNFTSGDQIIVGDEVIVYGTISKQYSNLNANSSIISINLAPRVTSVTLTPNAVTVDLNSDGNIADLFTNIVINQETGSNKTVNDIVWTSDDDNVFAVINDVQFIAGDTHRSSTTIHAFLNRKEFASATVNVFNANVHTVDYNLPEEWREVTDPSTLAAGDQVILTGVKNDNVFAAGTYASGNNLQTDEEHALTVSNGVATGILNTMIYTLEAGTADGSLAFKDSAGKYLYAAASGSNYMKVQDEIDGNASFILNSNGTVVAQGTNTRNYMRFNPNGEGHSLFSCYASSSNVGSVVKFYKLSGGTAELDLFNLTPIRSANDDENGTYINLGVALSENDWNAIGSAFGISGYGVMLIRETTLEATSFDTIAELYNSNDSVNKAKLSNMGKDSNVAPQDFSIDAKINITKESNRSVVFCAATYVKSSSGDIYFINEVRGSLVDLL